jgi:hypothetical protein
MEAATPIFSSKVMKYCCIPIEFTRTTHASGCARIEFTRTGLCAPNPRLFRSLYL